MNEKGEDLGELVIEEDADIVTSTGPATVDTDIDLDSTEETESISVSSMITQDTDSYSVSGSFIVLDQLLDILEGTVDEAVSYIRDHIVSFSLGTAFVIFIIVILAVFVSRKNIRTGGEELKLDNNRFYRKN
jgi:hypothetical protein